MTRMRAALLLLAVFLAGAAAGGFGAAGWMRHRMRATAWSVSPPEGARGLMLRRIARRLDLDADQRRLLERAADAARRRMTDVRKAALAEADEALEGVFDELEPALRPDQIERLRAVRSEARARFREGAGPPGPGRRRRSGDLPPPPS